MSKASLTKKRQQSAQNAATNLRLDWCSYKAAKYAVEHWHYSERVPRCGRVMIGVWEDEKFIGCVIFSKGANPRLSRPYNLSQLVVVELTRVALTAHITPVTKILRIAISMLKGLFPTMRLIVSYADANRGHLGKIYQAGNWIYEGEAAMNVIGVRVKGKVSHPRAVGKRYGSWSIPWLKANIDPDTEKVLGEKKHKYLYPLDKQMRKQIAHLSKPYPRSIGVTGSTSSDQLESGGSSPTVELNAVKQMAYCG